MCRARRDNPARICRARRGNRAAAALVVLVGTLFAAAALAGTLVAASAARAAADCDCGRYADELAATRALYASRGEGATSPPTDAARTRFRERVRETYTRARCLVACPGAGEILRD